MSDSAVEQPPIPRPATFSRERALGILWLLGLGIFYTVLSARYPLAPDETYYWEWSRNPALGYYDQGPMVAWTIWLTTALFGDTPLGVRFGSVIATLITGAFLWRTGAGLFGERAALIGLVSATITPLALAGGTIATYDPLMAACWAAACWAASRALVHNVRSAWWALGIAFGLGMLSKHSMILLAPCMVLLLASRRELRFWFARPEPYLAFLLGVLIFAPNLWWQSQNHWVTFQHLLVLSGKGADRTALRRFGDFVGSQAGVITPLLFLCILCSLVWSYRRSRLEDGKGEALAFWLGVPVLVLFTVMTAKSKVQANWALAGWLTPSLCLGAWAVAAGASRARWRAVLAAWALGTFLTLLIAMPSLRPMLGLRTPARWDQMNKLYGGPELGAAVEEQRRIMERAGGSPVTVGACTYDVASRMAFYLPDRPGAYCFFVGTRPNSYLFWNPKRRPPAGGNAVIADNRAPDDPERPAFERLFDHVEPVLPPVVVYRRGLYSEPIRMYYLYRCQGYRPGRPEEQWKLPS